MEGYNGKKAKKTQKCNNGDLHCSAVHTKKKNRKKRRARILWI